MTDIGGPYADSATLKRRMGIPDSDTTSDTDVADALDSASDDINRWTGRQFGQATVASERTFRIGPSGVDIDDVWTTDGLIVAGASWTGTGNYTLEPVNGIRDGVPGWPYERLSAPYAGHPLSHPLMYGGNILVTAKWGWAAVPAAVVTACLLLAADDLKSKDAPFGVAGFGDYAIRIRANPKVEQKLRPYILNPLMVAS